MKTQSEIQKAQIDAQTASQAAQKAKLRKITSREPAELKMKLATMQQSTHKQGGAQMAAARDGSNGPGASEGANRAAGTTTEMAY
jgi:hypothetical protein